VVLRSLIALVALALAACCSGPNVDACHRQTAGIPALRDLVDQALPEPKPPSEVEDLLPAVAIDLIVQFEINSPAYYERHLQAPVWPQGSSGVTVGIGYDLGHQAASVILQDWRAHSERSRLAEQAGITGQAARARIPSVADIRTRYALARQVFDDTTIVTYYRAMRRTYPGAEHLHPIAQGVLTSLTYNRGTSMTGWRRTEMVTLRDECVPAADYACMQRELRAMVRVWKGSSIENGMRRRRYAEADLLELIP
jgi:GH24 family phage-related lysozyme (muramidase)